MYQTFYIFQDILTKEIIGRGTKKEGLYYIDDIYINKANNMQCSSHIQQKKSSYDIFYFVKACIIEVFIF